LQSAALEVYHFQCLKTSKPKSLVQGSKGEKQQVTVSAHILFICCGHSEDIKDADPVNAVGECSVLASE